VHIVLGTGAARHGSYGRYVQFEKPIFHDKETVNDHDVVVFVWLRRGKREKEVAGRRAYERIGQGKVGQYRNGYHKPRRLTCGCGTVTIRVLRLEKPYESEIVPRYERLSPAMKKYRQSCACMVYRLEIFKNPLGGYLARIYHYHLQRLFDWNNSGEGAKCKSAFKRDNLKVRYAT